MSELQWQDLAKIKQGEIIEDWYDKGVRCLIRRGPASLCAYLGIPSSHPLAGFDCDSIPLECHGGLTFAGEGSKGNFPVGFYWYGWDYAHAGDYVLYYDDAPLKGKFNHSKEKKHLVEDVRRDINEALWNFKRLVSLAESIGQKVSTHKKSKSAKTS